MELLEGKSLRLILDEASPDLLSRDESFALLRGVGDALNYAHAKSAIHGDICPAAVFVTTDCVVKVLDLLPASSARRVPFFVEDTAPSGLVTPDPRDDVYGLACLAYELLSGRHPFNRACALEALNGGFTLTPISSLEAQRWDALARGLALRREHRTLSIAEFLSALGVSGQNEPRPARGAAESTMQNAASAGVDDRTASDDVPVIGDYSISPNPGAATTDRDPVEADRHQQARPSAEPSAFSEPVILPRDVYSYRGFANRRERRAPRTRARLASFAWLAALGVAGYLSYDPLRRGVEGLLAEAGPATQGNEPEPVIAVAPEAIVGVPAQTAVVAEARSAGAETEPAAAIIAHTPSAPAAADDNRSAAAAALARLEFATEVVTVSEADASAVVTIHRRGATQDAVSVAWWTSDGTAAAGDDYADLGRRIEAFAAGEAIRTIHVPIVGDSVTEGRESFYLNLAASDSQATLLEPTARLEVVIVDND
jgi:hypothetical protein